MNYIKLLFAKRAGFYPAGIPDEIYLERKPRKPNLIGLVFLIASLAALFAS